MTKLSALHKLFRKIQLVAFDFDGVFTDNAVYVFDDGTEAVRCFRGDGMGLDKLKKAGIGTVIISTETNPVVTARSKKLGIRCIQGCDDKLNVLKSIAGEWGISLDYVAFVGNDINDLDCLKSVGLPVIVADSTEDVIPYAKVVLTNKGGNGAVREFCNMIWEAWNSEK